MEANPNVVILSGPMLEHLQELAASKVSFAFETTFWRAGPLPRGLRIGKSKDMSFISSSSGCLRLAWPSREFATGSRTAATTFRKKPSGVASNAEYRISFTY